MNKEEVYNQIESFYNGRETKNDSKIIGKKYFYVDSQKAKDSVKFIAFLEKENKINFTNNLMVMDLCFGSGNLTSHIVLDNKLNVDEIYLNDIDTKVTNQDINIVDKSKILNYDFLDFTKFIDFEKRVDLLVFNPTISDNDIHRKIAIKDADKIVLFEENLDIKVAFKNYCEKNSIKILGDLNSIKIDRDKLTITCEIDGTKKDLNKLPNSFNNYSLICKTKNMQEYEDKTSTVVKINQTISTVLKDDGVIVFIGVDKQREVIFQNYEVVYRYLREDNDVFVIKKGENKTIECFEKDEDNFTICKDKSNKDDDCDGLFDDVEITLDEYEQTESQVKVEEQKTMKEEEKQTFSTTKLGKLDFKYKNILFKGVPGTGKSRAIDNIITKKLKIKEMDKQNNTLRINIHSASSNADLMQGIGISTKGQNVIYEEKQGLILDFIAKATYSPKQPFVLILEEIQENSLNELIGDLIYLIEEDKRTDLSQIKEGEYSYEEIVQFARKLLEEKNKNLPEDEKKSFNVVKVPNLVKGGDKYKEMILPDNLYIFCTSNYRDDKKIIEDNLLRRFEVIEIYPKNIVAHEYAREFFESLNSSILKVFDDEIHPDRYMIGHAIWKDVNNAVKFYRAFLKVVTEFKDIREIEFSTFEEVLKGVKLPDDIDLDITKQNGYFKLITLLQDKIGYGFTD